MSEAAYELGDNGGTIIRLNMRTPGVRIARLVAAEEIESEAKPGYEGRQKKGAGTRTMQPYESYFQIRDILERLDRKEKYRDYALVMTGLATGLRISDLVGLKVEDVYNVSMGKFRDVLNIREKKTGKSTVSDVDATVITDAIVYGLTKYFESLKWKLLPDDPLFRSDRPSGNGQYNLSECQGWRIVKGATADAKVEVNAGSHTLRKTFLNIANAVGTTSRLGNGSGLVLSDVMVLARHSNITTTLRYTSLMKSRLVSLRKGVSAFLMGKTNVKSLRMEYEWSEEV